MSGKKTKNQATTGDKEIRGNGREERGDSALRRFPAKGGSPTARKLIALMMSRPLSQAHERPNTSQKGYKASGRHPKSSRKLVAFCARSLKDHDSWSFTEQAQKASISTCSVVRQVRDFDCTHAVVLKHLFKPRLKHSDQMACAGETRLTRHFTSHLGGPLRAIHCDLLSLACFGHRIPHPTLDILAVLGDMSRQDVHMPHHFHTTIMTSGTEALLMRYDDVMML